MKTMILAAAALFLLPAAVMAQDTAAPADPAAAAAPAPAALPKCTAKVTDSCDQSATTEKNALSYYPAEKRDAGNNKIAAAPVKKARASKSRTISTTTTTTTTQ